MALITKHWWLRLARRALGLRDPGRFRYWKLYVLDLSDDCYYIGITSYRSVRVRYEQHASGKGAQWTRRHPPWRVRYVRTLGWMHERDAVVIETNTTVELIRTFGVDYVRGGRLVATDRYKHRAMHSAYVRRLVASRSTWW